ncbi:glycoside hydrolase family 16 protein [Bacillus cereus]|uniref:glycoside hydrolase family 16 protein n=1 Tax=Bacillus cereus TaxID=1396 RepID=UPI000B4ADAE2|nr:glycoside hydrolase family 16 protein [Bacillus cereus]
MKLKTICYSFALLLAAASLSNANTVKAEESKTVDFSGYKWSVRHTEKLEGPGPNYFSKDNVWVDGRGALHMLLSFKNGKWYGAELTNENALGYGDYRFYLETNINDFDPNLVLGMYTYDSISSDAIEKNNREIDIEISKWKEPNGPNMHYVLQPFSEPGNKYDFTTYLKDGDYTTQSFKWEPKKVSFESLFGHYMAPPTEDHLNNSWIYTGKDIPTKGKAQVSINLWLTDGAPPTNGQEMEVVFNKFIFTPSTEVEVDEKDEEKPDEIIKPDTEENEEQQPDNNKITDKDETEDKNKESVKPIQKEFKLVTGEFIGTKYRDEALATFEKLFGYKAFSESTGNKKKIYKIVTGEFIGEDKSTEAAADLRKQTGWHGNSEKTGKEMKVYRFVTGEFKGEDNVRAAVKEFNENIFWATYEKTNKANTYRIVSGEIYGDRNLQVLLSKANSFKAKKHWTISTEDTKKTKELYRLTVNGFYGDYKAKEYVNKFKSLFNWQLFYEDTGNSEPLYRLVAENFKEEVLVQEAIKTLRNNTNWEVKYETNTN